MTAAQIGTVILRKMTRVALALLVGMTLISPTACDRAEPEPAAAEWTRGQRPAVAVERMPERAAAEAAEDEYIPPAAEVEALAKMLYGEARGVTSKTEQAACVWVVLNRVDNPRFPGTVLEVIKAPAQFAGYSEDNPVTEELKSLAADVLTRHNAEKEGKENVGRVIPPEYLFFTGDGERNSFTKDWKSAETWEWTLESPYEAEKAVQ